MPRYVFAASALLLLAACQGREQPFGTGSQNSAPDKDAGAATLQLAGVYADTVPCNDCQGIATRLTLKPDSLYELQELYLGRTSPVNYRRGPWRVRGQVVTLEPSGNDPVRRYQVAGSRTLQLLDANGEPLPTFGLRYRSDGNLSEAGTRREFTGKYTYMADAAVFEECGSGKRYAVALAGGVTADLEKRYTDTRKTAGQPVFARVQGELQQQAGTNGQAPTQALVISQILEMKPDPICPQAQKQAFQQ
ncbi:copper resistance protein NlpE N-terminal domain-containing protein [Hymenobacter endophyticus]|uniref:Copper resistance protein NlpE N-terminal domain-containing protein n=1 Tax=Hymenobacter endophyticus TaxID=3076335 RepID=A0ABU3THM2_9BACT|nr:copper resistance protein NlpE N-terminal domain-containing protein [Hymenobacter endophyticus]MDU0370857.1 copper resistance protein NlpE N-terminal domain-containing protein [Hymenobacter endophyticus]